MDKRAAQVMVFAILCLTGIAIQCGFGGEAIAAIAGLVTGGSVGYAEGKKE